MSAPDLRSDETKAIDDARHKAVARAVATERERCAKIAERIAEANLNADNEATPTSSVAQVIANEIRSG